MALLCATPNANARLWKTTLKINHKTEAFVSLVVMAVVSRWLYSSIPPYQHLSSETIFWPDIVHRTHTPARPSTRPRCSLLHITTIEAFYSVCCHLGGRSHHSVSKIPFQNMSSVSLAPTFTHTMKHEMNPVGTQSSTVLWAPPCLTALRFMSLALSLSLWPVSPRPLQSAWPLRLLYLFYNNIIESMSNNGLY